MRQHGFGHTLREARVRKGLEFNEAARRLRIRPDVLRAIEEENFDGMPPRGYARNMVNSYARMLGLNATDITSMYLDAQREHDEEIRMANARPSGFNMDTGRARRTTARREYEKRSGSAFVRSDDQMRYMSERSRRATDGSGSINGLGRRVYTADSYNSEYEDVRAARINESANRTHRERRLENANDDYLSVYGGSSRSRGGYSAPSRGFDLSSLLSGGPVVLLIPVVAVLLVIGLIIGFVVLGPKQNADEVAPMPDTTVEQPAEDAAAKAPSSFTFQFSIKDGTSKWCEVHIDGKTEFAKTVNGPSTETFECSGKLKFVCYGTNGVTITVDGEEKELKAGKDGLCNYSVSLADILADWAKTNEDSDASGDSAADEG